MSISIILLLNIDFLSSFRFQKLLINLIICQTKLKYITHVYTLNIVACYT
jgi:hypothetical protein